MLTVGIVGLPNAGKSTLFNALTRSHQAPVAAYPFCTIDPNVGVIEVPDERLDRLVPIFECPKKIPTHVEFFDIAGLVRGASKGEGLGNRFLSHIREVDAIVEVARAFEQPDVTHVDGELDPLRDIETIRTELALADLETLERRKERILKLARAGSREAQAEETALLKLERALDETQTVRGIELSDDERKATDGLFLLTAKPVIYVVNVAENDLGKDCPEAMAVREYARSHGSEAVEICAELESQLADLDADEAKEYLESLEVESSGVDRLIRTAYETLGLITFFTGNEKEVRARSIPRGTTAGQAAGQVHTDIERGFIGAEVIAVDLLVKERTIHHAREDGRLRLEGKDYEVQDGDVVHFRFHV